MKLKTIAYNALHDTEGQTIMQRMKIQLKQSGESFGGRLARLRPAAGYTQRELASEIGISHRMVAYYEKEAGHIPIDLLPLLARTLEVSADQLLGIEKIKTNSRVRDTRLWRRFSQIEKLPPSDRKPLVHLIDTFLKGKKAEGK